MKDREISKSGFVGESVMIRLRPYKSSDAKSIVSWCKDEKTIRKHINNVFAEDELDRENNTQKMRVDGVKQKVPFADGCKRIAASVWA